MLCCLDAARLAPWWIDGLALGSGSGRDSPAPHILTFLSILISPVLINSPGTLARWLAPIHHLNPPVTTCNRSRFNLALPNLVNNFASPIPSIGTTALAVTTALAWPLCPCRFTRCALPRQRFGPGLVPPFPPSTYPSKLFHPTLLRDTLIRACRQQPHHLFRPAVAAVCLALAISARAVC